MNSHEKITAWIVPSTHWDREWVMTQGQFQVRLTNLVDRLLDICEQNPEYRFYFDGQTVALEDYLEVRPEYRLRLRRLLQSGQIAAGPWYGLADQFMQGGEAAIRNLLEGKRSCRELGAPPVMIGYVPDSFGSHSSLPMLLNEFGMKYAIFGRGRAMDKFTPLHNEFHWQSADGASVLAANFGYACGVFLSYPDIWQDINRAHNEPEAALCQFMKEAKKQRQMAAGKHLYFSVGIDHMEAKASLPTIVKYINAAQSEYELKFGMPDNYLQGVAETATKVTVYRGEQCGSKKFPMNLIGTLSSHVELKQANFRCEKILAGAVEPMMVMAEKFADQKSPAGMLRKMWKLLLVNQTHDSICGCSVDQVHRDMIPRFDFIENTAAYLLKDAAAAIMQQLNTKGSLPDAPAITVFNPLCGKRHTPIHALVTVPKRFVHKNYTLVNAAGKPVAARITRVTLKQMDLESVYMMPEQLAAVLSKNAAATRPDDQVFTVLDIDFVAHDLPMCGWKTWWLVPGKHEFSNAVRTTKNSMKNEFFKVKFHTNGSFDLTDLRNKREITNVLRFEDREDAGNLYDHLALPKIAGFNTSNAKAKIELSESLPHRATFKITIPFSIPAKLENNTARSAENVNIPITLLVSLAAGIPRIELAIECENQAKDHCLHAVFATGIKTATAESDVAFDVISRKVDDPEKVWTHRPMQHFVDASDGKHGLCVMTKGLYSQLATRAANGTAELHITLLRSTGHLGPGAGADYATPEGQCLGKHRFELAIMPHDGNWQTGNCAAAAAEFSSPTCVAAALPHKGKLPANGNTIATDATVVVSCLKQSEDGRKTIFRCWNPNETNIEIGLSGQLLSGRKISPIRADETAVKKKLVARAQGLFSVKF